MPLLYDIPSETVKELLVLLAKNLRRAFRKRAFAPRFIAHEWRSCSHNSQVRAAVRYLACLLRSLAKALGYTDAIKALLAEPRFTTMEELETIHKDKNRKKGRNVFNK